MSFCEATVSSLYIPRQRTLLQPPILSDVRPSRVHPCSRSCSGRSLVGCPTDREYCFGRPCGGEFPRYRRPKPVRDSRKKEKGRRSGYTSSDARRAWYEARMLGCASGLRSLSVARAPFPRWQRHYRRFLFSSQLSTIFSYDQPT